MAISEGELLSILKQKFPNAKIKLKDLAGDQDHYSLEINDPSFKNIPLVKQHKLVNTALAEVLHSKLHAVTIKTKHD
jgi:stress-induced morphogen